MPIRSPLGVRPRSALTEGPARRAADSHSSQVPVTVLIDGSALYLYVRALAETEGRAKDKESRGLLNYRALVQVLCDKVPPHPGIRPLTAANGSPDAPDWVMWTSSSPANAKQQNFLQFAERELHWQVRHIAPSSSFMIDPPALFGFGGDSTKASRLVRFDAAIAFAMGRLCEDHRIVVVTDSFALAEPIATINANRAEQNGKVVLAFFGRGLDPRWFMQFKEANSPEFINLDEYEETLFGTSARVVEAPAPRSGKTYF